MAHSRRKARSKALNRFANAGRALLVTAATALPNREEADRTRVTAAECLAAIKLITNFLKKAVPERRPDGDDNKSFPSEHTAMCVAAAMIVDREYPDEAGAVAWALAAAVALARIESKKHYPRDVVAGALIGWMSVRISLGIRSAIDPRN